jgi:Uncharacterized conserved protein (DUF2367)
MCQRHGMVSSVRYTSMCYSLLIVCGLTFMCFVLVGVIAAIMWFPLGIGLCLLDRRVQCKRCGESIEEGICN